ncbi:hypothetical protein M2145_002913 [Lachnospiraceae bacterium PF1-21]
MGNNYEDPTLEYDSENGGDLVQPMCCNFAVVGAIYVAIAVADILAGANWVISANGIAYVNALVSKNCG